MSGLREAHAHLVAHGRAASMVHLAGATSAVDAVERLGAAAAALAPDAWLLGTGARPESWPERDWPTLAEIDAAVPDRPSLAWCFDYHAVLLNSAGLRAVGIGDSTPDPPGGVIVRDSTRRPTGVLLESAALRAWAAVPEPTLAESREHVERALSDLAALGFAEVHDLKSQPWLGPMLADLARDGRLPLRVHLYPLVDDLPAVAAGRRAWESDRVRLAGGKVFTDGTLNSRTASMLHPFADPIPDHPRGTPMMTADEIDTAIGVCEGLGVGLAAHAIGDGAVRAVLDAVERVRPRACGVRVEHAEIVDRADVPRFARLGVVCSVQPCHLLADIEALRRFLPQRLDRVFPLRDLIDAGCEPGRLLLFGSDTPIVRPDPSDSILAATARGRSGEPPEAAIAPEQAVSEAEAWACFGAG